MRHHQPRIEELRPRAADRVRVDLDAFLSFDEAPEVPVFVRDLSTHGFKCRCAERLAIGSPVTLRVPGLGEFPATVAWQLGFQAGIRFIAPVPLTKVLSMVLSIVQEELGKPDPIRPLGDAA